jgi:hypothetical protein
LFFKRKTQQHINKTPILIKKILKMSLKQMKLEEINKEKIQEVFTKCINGFHFVNDKPINESTWEDVNTQIFECVGVPVYSKADGSHTSGMDIECAFGGISNKSAKYTKEQKSFDISSYRLTTVCNESSCGTPEEICEEINKRKNFDYYSFILRDDTKNSDTVQYDWYLIPSGHSIFNPCSYTWKPMIGKRGKKKDTQIGWETNVINGSYMTITFSMSSQLWIHVEKTKEIENMIIASSSASTKRKFNYMQLFDFV